MLTQERLLEVIHYCPESGKFTWIMDRGGAWSGKEAGCLSTISGYALIRIDGVLYRAHRLAWLYVYGETPCGAIDHVNGIAKDNRILNLRLATQSQNMQNKRASSASKTGVKGVCYCSATGRYQVKIRVDGKYKHIGRFDTVEEGATAYAEAARRYFGEFARTT
ncbi:HNH endonuclease [Pseudomonas aeruginosa]|uniref:HNH endonuclease n=1 Tax=Pseudomonas aeruginosa TaxID=287 RepID=UPI00249EDF93|nr:HNH endonuclease [Pseudomonas aeruginosa]WGY37377.1 HNH endonuclease [Pseudomonas aeruginosa]